MYSMGVYCLSSARFLFCLISIKPIADCTNWSQKMTSVQDHVSSNSFTAQQTQDSGRWTKKPYEPLFGHSDVSLNLWFIQCIWRLDILPLIFAVCPDAGYTHGRAQVDSQGVKVGCGAKARLLDRFLISQRSQPTCSKSKWWGATVLLLLWSCCLDVDEVFHWSW